MRRALLIVLLAASGCSSLSEVDRAKLLRRVELLGEGFAIGKSAPRAAEIRSETAALCSDLAPHLR